MPDDGAGVRIRGLRKVYGDTIALNGLDLDAHPGEIVGVAGPNGAGKSTMMKILAGEVDWDEGEGRATPERWAGDIGPGSFASGSHGRSAEHLARRVGDLGRVRQYEGFHGLAVGHRSIHRRYEFDRRLQVLESVLGHFGCDNRCRRRMPRRLIHAHQPPGFLDRLHDRLRIQRR